MPVPIALVDHDCHFEPSFLFDMAEMLTVVSQRDFARSEPYGYGVGAEVRVARSLKDVGEGEWILAYWSKPKVPGVLGVHDVQANGRPILHVYPFMDAPDNRGIVESHEVFEALADAQLACTVVGQDGLIRAREVCDPVETTHYSYLCSSGRILKVSNFVTPAYFNPPAAGNVPLDFLRQVTLPGEILPGGYQIFWTPGHGWTQTVNGRKRPYRQTIEALPTTRGAQRVTRTRGDHER